MRRETGTLFYRTAYPLQSDRGFDHLGVLELDVRLLLRLLPRSGIQLPEQARAEKGRLPTLLTLFFILVGPLGPWDVETNPRGDHCPCVTQPESAIVQGVCCAGLDCKLARDRTAQWGGSGTPALRKRGTYGQGVSVPAVRRGLFAARVADDPGVQFVLYSPYQG